MCTHLRHTAPKGARLDLPPKASPLFGWKARHGEAIVLKAGVRPGRAACSCRLGVVGTLAVMIVRPSRHPGRIPLRSMNADDSDSGSEIGWQADAAASTTDKERAALALRSGPAVAVGVEEAAEQSLMSGPGARAFRIPSSCSPSHSPDVLARVRMPGTHVEQPQERS